ncbi:MAG TPA: VTT domain-containing protein [Rhodanobacteraceae bacterium]
MAHTLSLLIAQYGLIVVFASAFVEQIGAPVPALPVLIVAGAAAAAGHLPIAGVVVVAMAGCLLPDLMWYFTGRRLGARVMHGLCKLSLSPDSCVHRSELHFERWHGRSLLIAKFVPGLSVVAPPLVGALGLRLRAFLLLDGIGSLLWVGVGVGLGWVFANQIEQVLEKLAGVSHVAVAVVVVALALYLGVKWWHRRQVRMALQIARITPAELNQMLIANRRPLILDVRSRTSRELDPRIIEGAELAAAEDVAQAVRTIPLDRAIVSYCSCPHEATSAKVATTLQRRGYRDVHPLLGGLPAWVAAGYRSSPLPARGHADATAPLQPEP